MSALLSVKDLGKRLNVSERTIHRLKDAGKLPAPVRVGGWLIRWEPTAIDEWIADGCPRCDGGRKGGAR